MLFEYIPIARQAAPAPRHPDSRRRHSAAGLRVAAIITVVLCQASIAHSQTRTYSRDSKSNLHLGASTVLADPTQYRRQALDFAEEPKRLSGTSGAPISSWIKIREIRSHTELFDLLQRDFRLHVKSLFAKGAFSRTTLDQRRFTGDSVTWTLEASTDFGWYELSEPECNEGAIALLSSDPASFKSKYGDAVVNRHRKAALVAVVFSQSSENTATMSHLKQNVNASGGTFAVSGGIAASEQHLVTYALASGELSYEVYADGGSGLAGLGGTIQNYDQYKLLRTSIAEYVKGVKEENAPAVEYQVVPLRLFCDGPDLIIIDPQDGIIASYYEKWLSYQEGTERLQVFLADHGCLSDDRRVYFEELHKQYESDLTELVAAFHAGVEDGTIERFPKSPPRFDLPHPTIYIAGYSFWPGSEHNTGWYAGAYYGYVDGCDVEEIQLRISNTSYGIGRQLMSRDELKTAALAWIDTCIKEAMKMKGNAVFDPSVVVKAMTELKETIKSNGLRVPNAGDATWRGRKYFLFPLDGSAVLPQHNVQLEISDVNGNIVAVRRLTDTLNSGSARPIPTK